MKEIEKKEIIDILKKDKEKLIPKNIKKRFFYFITKHNNYNIYKIIKTFRYYYYYKEKNNYIGMILWGNKKNKIMHKYNIELPKKLGSGITLPHRNCIINEFARIGDNCCFHGFNLVGNNGKNDKAPNIGKNVDIGAGAIIIGDITIADNCKIGANALVNKSCLIENSVLIGVPAKMINKN